MSSEPGAADRLIEWTGERCVPWTGDLQVVYEHFHRYLLATRLVAGKRVLDLASGEGYGVALLSQSAERVIGVELDPLTVQHSRSTYPLANVEFLQGSMLDLSRFEAGSFDVVTCFEALEHVTEHDELFEQVRRVLAPTGIFLSSTPDRLVYSEAHDHHNPFHVRELSLDEYREVLGEHFAHAVVWGQAVVVGSLMTVVDGPGSAPELLAIGRDGDEWQRVETYPPTYYVAAASSVPLPDLPAQSVLADVEVELVRSAQRAAAGGDVAAQEREVAARAHIAATEAEVERLGGELRTAAELLDLRAAENSRAQRVIDDLSVDLAVQHELAEALRAGRATLEQALEARGREVAAVAHELAVIRGSRAHRLVQRYYRAVEKAAPAGTRRRRAYGTVGRTAVRGLRALRPLPDAAAPVVPDRLPMLVAAGTDALPTVSIVIPVHGKWAVTAQCLRSFAAHPPTVPYELVVVDDASPDDSRARLGDVPGLRVVALDVNRGFIGAVNAGLEACRGEYVVLLNNDTEITEGWLEALLETVREPGVGLVGSKLVYPDGRLQEAGGIIFENAGGWNYGRTGDPSLERYNVPRDVDYCSGAAVMVRRDLLTELGGLDEHFAPAYYDDVDLAFTLRERGLRVVYQPRAVVVHHEGVSHGTDETSGIKAYQGINRLKIVERWGRRLAEHLDQDPALVERAARRGTRGIVVVIDHHVPRPDEDSGSVRMFGLLTTLRRLGWYVIFAPDNRSHGDVWGDRLLAAGVEVFCGPEPLEQFLASLRGSVAAVIGARVGIAWPYLSMVRRVLPNVPFLFDTVDLHHLREQREAELTGDPAAVERAAATRALELGLVTASDATFVVSPYEVEVLAREVPGARVHVVPNVHVQHPVGPGPERRRGILFVGSFGHPPNVDAVRWFVDEIFPLVRAQEPHALFRVVGRGAPESLTRELPAGVEMLGWVEDLTDLYAASRVSVAPLRYGAGIKGKVGEALSHGLPVVATPMAAEGMGLVDGVHGAVAEDPAAFAAGVVRLLRDDELWRSASAAGRDLVEETLGTARFEALLAAALADVAPVTSGADES
jgi:GT2 family glycosyltransferase/SAM-dependent methyltransferase